MRKLLFIALIFLGPVSSRVFAAAQTSTASDEYSPTRSCCGMNDSETFAAFYQSVLTECPALASLIADTEPHGCVINSSMRTIGERQTLFDALFAKICQTALRTLPEPTWQEVARYLLTQGARVRGCSPTYLNLQQAITTQHSCEAVTLIVESAQNQDNPFTNQDLWAALRAIDSWLSTWEAAVRGRERIRGIPVENRANDFQEIKSFLSELLRQRGVDLGKLYVEGNSYLETF